MRYQSGKLEAITEESKDRQSLKKFGLKKTPAKEKKKNPKKPNKQTSKKKPNKNKQTNKTCKYLYKLYSENINEYSFRSQNKWSRN